LFKRGDADVGTLKLAGQNVTKLYNASQRD